MEPDLTPHVISWRTFSEFYESIYAAAADMGVVIPAPDPEWRRRKEVDDGR